MNYLETHRYAPELNVLILGGRKVKVGFFGMNYNPTFQQALNYAYSKGLITLQELQDQGYKIQTVANTHNEAFWQGEKTFIHPWTGKEVGVGYKVVQNYESFHTYGS